jgi:hypothetical protein
VPHLCHEGIGRSGDEAHLRLIDLHSEHSLDHGGMRQRALATDGERTPPYGVSDVPENNLWCSKKRVRELLDPVLPDEVRRSEHVTAIRVDYRHPHKPNIAFERSCEHAQRADSNDGQTQTKSEPFGRTEAHTQAGESARPDIHANQRKLFA